MADPTTNPNIATPPVAAITNGNNKQVTRSSTVITNPIDPEAPVKAEAPSSLPQSTIDEMNAGKKALERNRPVAQALEEARLENDRKPGDQA